jgi:LemA protein
MIVVWVLIGVAVVLGGFLVVSYNRFVSQRQQVRNAWANIDTELRRRYDLIPNLVETVRGYAAHEREVFEEVARARSMAMSATGSPAEQAAAEGPLVAALRQLFAVAENYPQLRANENFLALQSELANTENRLQGSRRFYNATVQDFNRRVQAFPSNLVANWFRFTPEQFFEIEEAVRPRLEEAPRVDFRAQAGSPAAPVAPSPPDAPTGPGGPAAPPPPAGPPGPAVPPPAPTQG